MVKAMTPNGDERTAAARHRFRAILKRKKLTVMPGGFSPFYALIAQAAGFDCFFLAGSQVSTFLYGLPDNGLIGLREMVDHARHVAARCDIPVLVDADTGYGNAVNVHYAVQEILRAGAAGLQIEDQEAPKKSGTAAGRRLIPIEEAVGKIQAACAARDAIDPAFVICARCDGMGAEQSGFDDVLERAIAYIEKGGADLVWLNSVETRAQLKRACKEIPGPVLAGWGGDDPAPTWQEYEKLGVRIALYPTVAGRVGLQAAWEVLHDFKARGTVALDEWHERSRKNPYGQPSREQLLDYDAIRAIEDRFLPREAQRDYGATRGHGRYADSGDTAKPIARSPRRKPPSRRKEPTTRAGKRGAKG